MDAFSSAKEVLRACSETIGFRASGKERGYHTLWARDASITILGAVLVDDGDLLATARASLLSLAEHQGPRGSIPNCVHTERDSLNRQAYADSSLWFVLAACEWCAHRPEDSSALFPAVIDALGFASGLDAHEEGLLTMEEGSDWMDLFPVRGRGLLVNALYVWALRAAAGLAEREGEFTRAEQWRSAAHRTEALVHKHFWYPGDGNLFRHVQLTFGAEKYDENGVDELGRKAWIPKARILGQEQYFIQYFTFRTVGERFDTLANLVAILSGLATDEQAEHIFAYIERHGLAEPFPVRAVHPVILPGDAEWREYFSFGGLNLPHQYHNGGVWPFIGGFYVAALVQRGHLAKARSALASLIDANLSGEGRFSEWLHAASGAASGVAFQAWSAAMLLFAHGCVERGCVPLTALSGLVSSSEHKPS